MSDELAKNWETLQIDDGITLPLDVLGVIAKHLIDDNAYGTCAALNVTSKGVEIETSPTLWKTCVLLGAKSFASLPPSSRTVRTSSVSANRVRSMENEMLGKWEQIIKAKRAKWIQLVAFPCMIDMVNMGDVAKRALFGDKLVRLKAVLTINRHLSRVPGLFTLTVSPTEKYEYGSTDVVDLSKAIDLFQQAGGNEIVEVCNERDGILLVLQSSLSSDKHSPTEISAQPRHPAYTPYVPVAVKIYGGEESSTRFSSAFLEASQWLRRENPKFDDARVLEVVHDDKEYLFACARIFQKAARVDPALTTIPIRFHFGEELTLKSAVASHERTALDLLTIFRETFLLAYPRLQPDTIGCFWIGVVISMTASFASWEINSSKLGHLVSMFKFQEEPTLVAVDPLPKLKSACKKFRDPLLIVVPNLPARSSLPGSAPTAHRCLREQA